MLGIVASQKDIDTCGCWDGWKIITRGCNCKLNATLMGMSDDRGACWFARDTAPYVLFYKDEG